MKLTERQRELLRAALSYALANIDDLNDAVSMCDDEDDHDGFSEEAAETLAKLFNINIR